ncbi:MAG TPA: IS1595 family transposase [Rhizomicrobium sp.]|nr:IS1595 family transposase [Rhizomicrobium sp.]
METDVNALSAPIFTDEMQAIAHLEALRWPEGIACPLCGSARVRRMGGRTQAGMFLCNGCRGKFTVRTGTLFQRSHIPIRKWLLATHLMAASERGITAQHLHRLLGISGKSAWFMAHRIRQSLPETGPG